MSITGLTRSDQNFFKKQKTFLEGGKESDPFKGFGLPSNYKETEASAFEKSGANVSDYYEPSKESKNKFEKGDSKGFLSKQLDNVKSYLEATKDEKSEEDKDRDLIRELAGQSNLTQQFGDMTKGFGTEVAKGLIAYQPPSPNQQMFIPGEKAQGKSLGQRFAGGLAGLGQGLMTGVPGGGYFGAISGFFG